MRSTHNDDKSFMKQNSYHRIARTNLKRSLDKYHYSIKIQTREAQNQHQLKSLLFRLDLANTVIYYTVHSLTSMTPYFSECIEIMARLSR